MSETKETHVHVLEDGTVVEHSHGEHGHHHSHAQTKSVLNRLSRAIGHLESIKRMVESGRDCSEVLIQLSAVKSAINNTGKYRPCSPVDRLHDRKIKEYTKWQKNATTAHAISQAVKDVQARARAIHRISLYRQIFFLM